MSVDDVVGFLGVGQLCCGKVKYVVKLNIWQWKAMDDGRQWSFPACSHSGGRQVLASAPRSVINCLRQAWSVWLGALLGY